MAASADQVESQGPPPTSRAPDVELQSSTGLSTASPCCRRQMRRRTCTIVHVVHLFISTMCSKSCRNHKWSAAVLQPCNRGAAWQLRGPSPGCFYVSNTCSDDGRA